MTSERQWRRRHLRILAARRRRLDAAAFKIRRQIHPAHERHLRERAFDGHTCQRIAFAPYLGPWLREHVCPGCGVERADYEGPARHLPTCPSCGSPADPVPAVQP